MVTSACYRVMITVVIVRMRNTNNAGGGPESRLLLGSGVMAIVELMKSMGSSS